jgi:hypothetical protein
VHGSIRRNCALVVANLFGDADPVGDTSGAATVAIAAAGGGGGAAAGRGVPQPQEGGLDMPHDDLVLPVLGICAPDSSQPELAICASALVRRRLGREGGR